MKIGTHNWMMQSILSRQFAQTSMGVCNQAKPYFRRDFSTSRESINVLHFKNIPIYTQLQVEELLLRHSTENWLILNDGTEPPVIVMGISGKPENLIHVHKAKESRVSVIKRFTGGGTVLVDSGTIFASFIINKGAFANLPPYPRQIMEWSETFYKPVFLELAKEPHGRMFRLRENDYVFGELKFGGNAQSIVKDRWIHHTSFLWDYSQERMQALKNPSKQPEYRSSRDHKDFLCKLSEVSSRRSEFFNLVHLQLPLWFGHVNEAPSLLEALTHIASKLDPGFLHSSGEEPVSIEILLQRLDRHTRTVWVPLTVDQISVKAS